MEKSSFDPDLVLEQVGGDRELLNEMIVIFRDMYPTDLEEIRESVEARDRERIRKSAHRMKGSVSNFTSGGAFLISRELEESAGEEDLAHQMELVKRLDNELRSLETEMKEFSSVTDGEIGR